MKIKRIFIIAVLVLGIFINVGFGQTASQIERKYGKPVLSYAVSEHIWMTPEFTGDGQMCKARLYPKHISADTDYLTGTLARWELKDVLNELAPMKSRGEKTKLFGMSLMLGQMAVTNFGYEKVTFSFLTSLQSGFIEVGSKSDSVAKESDDKKPVDDIFDNSLVQKAEIVTVSWNDRKCAKN